MSAFTTPSPPPRSPGKQAKRVKGQHKATLQQWKPQGLGGLLMARVPHLAERRAERQF